MHAKDLEQRIRMTMGVVFGCDLPEKQLHWTAYPTKSKRPDMISLWEASGPSTVSRPFETPKVIHQPDQDKPAPPVTPPPPDDAAVTALYTEYQLALAKWGDTPYTRDLLDAVMQAIRISPLESERLERRLDALHASAFPQANPPRRLHIAGQLEGILED